MHWCFFSSFSCETWLLICFYDDLIFISFLRSPQIIFFYREGLRNLVSFQTGLFFNLSYKVSYTKIQYISRLLLVYLLKLLSHILCSKSIYNVYIYLQHSDIQPSDSCSSATLPCVYRKDPTLSSHIYFTVHTHWYYR